MDCWARNNKYYLVDPDLPCSPDSYVGTYFKSTTGNTYRVSKVFWNAEDPWSSLVEVTQVGVSSSHVSQSTLDFVEAFRVGDAFTSLVTDFLEEHPESHRDQSD